MSYGPASTISQTTHALKCIEYEHHKIHGGNHYTITHSVSNIGDAASPDDAITLTFTTPNTTKWLHMVVDFEAVGGSLCRIREGGSGGGSATGTITAKNNNRNSSNTSGIIDIEGSPTAGQVSYDAGLDSGGTLIFDQYLAGAATNQNKGGVGASSRLEWILKQNTRYQISIVEDGAVSAAIVLRWYEHTDKD